MTNIPATDTGFKRPMFNANAQGFYASRILIPSSYTTIPNNKLLDYLRRSHLQDDTHLRLALQRSVLDNTNMLCYLTRWKDDKYAKSMEKHVKDEKTSKLFSINPPAPVRCPDPTRLLQAPPLDFTRPEDITVYLPCAVKQEEWDQLKLLKYEADMWAMGLWQYALAEDERSWRDVPTCTVVGLLMQMSGDQWMAGKMEADRLMAASRLACCLDLVDDTEVEEEETEPKPTKRFPERPLLLEGEIEVATVRTPAIRTAATGTTTTTDNCNKSPQSVDLFQGVRITRDLLRKGHLLDQWEADRDSDTEDARANNGEDERDLDSEESFPTFDSVCFDPIQAYEDLRLELCARRYKRALIAQQVRIIEEYGNACVGETDPTAVNALDDKGRRRMTELERRLRQDFPIAGEVVRWRVAWERDEIED